MLPHYYLEKFVVCKSENVILDKFPPFFLTFPGACNTYVIFRLLKALKLLAGDDPDFAATRNNVGFNKMDADFGHSLAANNHLSDKQREYGKRLLRKYHRQIPSDLWIEIFGDARND